MNTGVIASRYAKALLRYAGDISDGDVLCTQAMTLEKAMIEIPKLRQFVQDPTSTDKDRKIELLDAALGGQMHPSLRNFITLVLDHGRESHLVIILHDFVDRWFLSKKILRAKLTSVVPSARLEESLSRMVKQQTGCDVIIESTIDPQLIGGFVFTVDDVRLDASVSGQIEALRRQFIENTKRLI